MSDWWSEWVAHHATVFGFEKDAEMAMLDSWRAAFSSLNYTREELFAATQAVVVKAPKWRNEHLSLIQETIRERREVQRKAEEAKNQYGGASWIDCNLCNGSAYVIVPLLKAVVNMEWVQRGNTWDTCAVVCRCRLGQMEADRRNATRSDGRRLMPMTLGEYEQHNPGWLQQLDLREKQVKAELHARNVSREMDRTLGPLMQRLRQLAKTIPQQPMPGPEPQSAVDDDGDVPF